MATTTGSSTFTQYNGQSVLADDATKKRMEESVLAWNKATGQSLTAMDYDKKLNPTTYGARWGVAETEMPGYTIPPASTNQAGGLLYSGANTPQAATYAPTAQTVSEKSTVQNQLANITANGSALNTQAEVAANKAMAGRGLLNTSIAVGAARDAVIKNALPIAQQDAGTYANTDSANAQFSNTADQFNAGQKNQITGQLISADTSLAVADKNIKSQQLISDKDNATKLQMQQLDTETKKALAGLDEQTKVKLQNLDASDKQLLQTNISAANAYAQLAQALANISTSTTMDAAAKQQATDNQIGLFRQNLQALGKVSGLDLSKYFETVTASTSAQGNTTGDPAANQANAQQAASDAAGML